MAHVPSEFSNTMHSCLDCVTSPGKLWITFKLCLLTRVCTWGLGNAFLASELIVNLPRLMVSPCKLTNSRYFLHGSGVWCNPATTVLFWLLEFLDCPTPLPGAEKARNEVCENSRWAIGQIDLHLVGNSPCLFWGIVHIRWFAELQCEFVFEGGLALGGFWVGHPGDKKNSIVNRLCVTARWWEKPILP